MPHLSPLTSHFSPLTFHLWLSVDPLSDKYPGVSPYVYCANNPVKLVDVDGRSWGTPEDAGKYKILLNHAINAQDKYEQGSLEYNLIQEGIDGLNFMDQDSESKYTFSEFYKDDWTPKSNMAGYISIEGDNPIHRTYYISYLHDDSGVGFTPLEQGEAWHEVAHLSRALISFRRTDYMKWKTGKENGWTYIQTSCFGITSDMCLGIANEDRHYEECAAYKSQMMVYPASMPTPIGDIFGHISTDNQIRKYVRRNY